MKIDAYPDNYVTTKPDVEQLNKNPGSIVTFEVLREKMRESADVLIYIHGFNVSWEEAVASALALQLTLNGSSNASDEKEIVVVLFTWLSDGQAIPIYSYKSDRSDAEFSGSAFGRGLLKFRDFLVRLNTRERVFENAADKYGKPKGQLLCEQDVHISQKVHQINCSEIVTGAVEHSYYLDGVVNEDIRMSIASVKQDAETRRRHINKNAWPNIWTLHL